MATNNAANISAAGVVTYDGAGTFTGSSVTQHYVLVGGSSNAITSVSPSTSGFVLTSTGASSDPSFQATVGGNLVTVTGGLTNAQIKALHATPVQVVAAPGVGSYIKLIACAAKMTYGGSNVFTAGAGQVIALFYGTTISSATVLSNANIVAASTQVQSAPATLNVTGLYSQVDNAALNLYVTVATEITGNAANDNTVTYSVTYQIITI